MDETVARPEPRVFGIATPGATDDPRIDETEKGAVDEWTVVGGTGLSAGEF